MSHPQKATSSCDLKNNRLLILEYEDKNCLESKTNKKNNLHHRMFELSRKSYIIMLSGKCRLLRLDYEHKSCLETKIN